jgi:hypothetical protein
MKGQNADFVIVEYCAREIVHSRIFPGNFESVLSRNIMGMGPRCVAGTDIETILGN